MNVPYLSEQDFSEQFCEEHLNELQHLYGIRNKAYFLSEFELADLINLDKKIFGHLNGLFLRKTSAWHVLKKRYPNFLFSKEIVLAALCLELTTSKPISVNRVSLFLSKLDLSNKFIFLKECALWIPESNRIDIFNGIRDDAGNRELTAIIQLMVLRNLDNALKIIKDNLKTSNIELLQAILDTIAEFRIATLRPAVLELLRHDNVDVRAAAYSCALSLESGFLLNDIQNHDWSDLSDPTIFYKTAILLPSQKIGDFVKCLLNSNIDKNIAILTAAFSCHRGFLSWYIQLFDIPEFKKLAGICFYAITNFKATRDEGSVADHEPLSHIYLTDPDPDLAIGWMNKYYDKIDAGNIIGGKFLEKNWLTDILLNGFQFQRVIACMHLNLSYKSHDTLYYRFPAYLQRHILLSTDKK
jgi:hypothetical protein